MDRPILFSYRHAGQKAFVERFEHECRAHLLTTWRDDRVPLGESPEEHVERMLPKVDVVLLFVSEATFDGLQDPRTGLHREVKRLLNRQAQDRYALVLVDLEGYSTATLATFPLIGGGTTPFALRVVADRAFRLFEADAPEQEVQEALRDPVGQIVARQRGVDVFPRSHATRIPGVYLLSAIGLNGSDHLRAEARVSSQEGNDERPRLPLRDAGGQQIVTMAFEHHDGSDDYWAGIIGLDSDDAEVGFAVTARRDPRGEWLPRDLTRMRSMELDMRMQGTDRPVPIQVRFEDDAWDGRPGSSFHQSTSWTHRSPLVGTSFRRLVLDLDEDFDWGADAFPFNTRPPDRRRILQITFGHDSRTAATAGRLEIRRLSFSPTAVERPPP